MLSGPACAVLVEGGAVAVMAALLTSGSLADIAARGTLFKVRGPPVD